MVKINKIEYEPEDMPPGYNHQNHWEEVVNAIEKSAIRCLNFSDRFYKVKASPEVHSMHIKRPVLFGHHSADFSIAFTEVTLFESHPDFSDKAMHLRGYVIVAYRPWMAVRSDLYFPVSEGKVRVNQVFVDSRDWTRIREAAWNDLFRRRPRWY